MKKITTISVCIIICLNLFLTIGSNESLNNINLMFLSAKAWPWDTETDPLGQIEIESECVITRYGCFNCGSGDGLCIIPGLQIECVDQYVCPSCTCNPQECYAVYEC